MQSAREGSASSNGFTHFPALDGLRGIAIILVIIAHTLSGSLAIPGSWHRLGGLGVMLFFVLSGFLITGVLIANEEQHGRIDLREFYVRRALRIFPAAYLFLTFILAGVVLGWVDDVPWRTFAAAALYLRNIFGRGTSVGHLWSLSIEEQFYLVWPPVLLLAGCRRGFAIALLATIGFAAFRTIAIIIRLFPYETAVFYERPWFRFDSLLAGCCLALLRRDSRDAWQRLLRIVRDAAPPILIAPLAVVWTLWAEGQPWARPIYLTVQLVLATLMFLEALAASTGPVARALTRPALKTVGRLSYSLYLWQQIFLVTTTPSWGVLRVFPVNLVMTVAAASASYYLIERPFLRLKDSGVLRTWLARRRPASP